MSLFDKIRKHQGAGTQLAIGENPDSITSIAPYVNPAREKKIALRHSLVKSTEVGCIEGEGRYTIITPHRIMRAIRKIWYVLNYGTHPLDERPYKELYIEAFMMMIREHGHVVDDFEKEHGPITDAMLGLSIGNKK